jgi:hypothetical protein
MPPEKKRQTSARWSAAGDAAAAVPASFRLKSVFKIGMELTAAQFSCPRKRRREMGCDMVVGMG